MKRDRHWVRETSKPHRVHWNKPLPKASLTNTFFVFKSTLNRQAGSAQCLNMDVIFTQKTNHLVNSFGSLSFKGGNEAKTIPPPPKKGGWGGKSTLISLILQDYKGRNLRLHFGAMFSTVYICWPFILLLFSLFSSFLSFFFCVCGFVCESNKVVGAEFFFLI